MASTACPTKLQRNLGKERRRVEREQEKLREKQFVTLTDASNAATPDPVSEVGKIMGSLTFLTPVVRLFLSAQLEKELDSICTVEVNACTGVGLEKWVEVCRSNPACSTSEPRYYGHPHMDVAFDGKDHAVRISVVDVTDPQSHSVHGSAILSMSSFISAQHDKQLTATILIGELKKGELIIASEVHEADHEEPMFRPSNDSRSKAKTKVKDAGDSDHVLTRFRQPRWVDKQRVCILPYEQWFHEYRDRLDYQENVSETSFVLSTVLGPGNPLDKNVYLTITKVERDKPVNANLFRRIRDGHWIFKGEVVNKSHKRPEWVFKKATREISAHDDEGRAEIIVAVWTMEGSLNSHPHSFAKLPLSVIMTAGKDKVPIFACPRSNKLEPAVEDTPTIDLTTDGGNGDVGGGTARRRERDAYLFLDVECVLSDKDSTLSELALNQQIVRDFYRRYLIEQLRYYGPEMIACKSVEQHERELRSTLLKSLFSGRRVDATIIFDRSRRNGIQPKDMTQRKLLYLHERGSVSPYNVYAQIMARFATAYLGFHPRKALPIYFFGADKVTPAGGNGGRHTDDEEWFEAATPIHPLQIAEHTDIMSPAEVFVAYDSCLKKHRTRRRDAALAPVLREAIRRHPPQTHNHTHIAHTTHGHRPASDSAASAEPQLERYGTSTSDLDAAGHHSVILFITASDLRDDNDAGEMMDVLKELRGKDISVVFVRLLGPHLRKFELLDPQLLRNAHTRAHHDTHHQNVHFVDIRTFPRLARTLEYHAKKSQQNKGGTPGNASSVPGGGTLRATGSTTGKSIRCV